MNNMLSASVLDSWARENPRKAQELLPELVLRLILRTSSQIADYDFPIEKGIQYSGYDGVLVSDEKTSYFPKGKSVWECGTNDDSLSKFESDIQKRTNNPLGVNVTEATFIFVTLKIWNHKKSIEELRNESRKKYPWKDIRMIDGCKIAIWLQEFTAVAAWFAEATGSSAAPWVSGMPLKPTFPRKGTIRCTGPSIVLWLLQYPKKKQFS